MNGYGNSVFLRTAWEVSGGIAPVNTVAPAITGTAQEGQTVTCSTGTWTGTPTISYTYQWKRNGSNIGSATSSTYVLVLADVSQSITCQVTATNGSGSASATSNIITPIAAVDPDAQAFITAAAITDPTQQAAINTLVVDLKGYNVWTKMKALYPMVGSTASQQKFNLKDPRDLDAAFRLQFFGGWTHSVNGALPNGTNAYADTGFNVNTYKDNNHLSYYIRTNLNEVSVDAGLIGGSGQFFDIESRLSNVGYFGNHIPATFISFAVTDSRGLWLNTRTTSTLQKVYKNGTSQGSNTASGTSVINANIYLGARNIYGIGVNLYSTKETAFASIGDGLTDTEAANLYTAVQNMQIALARQV